MYGIQGAFMLFQILFGFYMKKAIDINLFWMGNNTVGITYEYFKF